LSFAYLRGYFWLSSSLRYLAEKAKMDCFLLLQRRLFHTREGKEARRLSRSQFIRQGAIRWYHAEQLVTSGSRNIQFTGAQRVPYIVFSIRLNSTGWMTMTFIVGKAKVNWFSSLQWRIFHGHHARERWCEESQWYLLCRKAEWFGTKWSRRWIEI